MRLNERKATAT